MSWRDHLNAYGELAGRYLRVWRHFWAERDRLRTGLLTEDEAEFLPAALAVQERPISPTARGLAWLLVIMVVTGLAWALFGRMDIVVNAAGKVVPSGRVKTIASVDTARVVALHVTEGQLVTAGQTLVELDTTPNDAQRDKAFGDAGEAALQLARNEALVHAIQAVRAPQMPTAQILQRRFGTEISPAKWRAAAEHVQGQYRDYATKLARLDVDIATYRDQLPLAAQQAQSYRELALTQDVARIDALAKEQAWLQLRGQLRDAQHQRAALIAETERAALDEIAAARRTVESSLKDAEHYQALSRLYILQAPVSGTVQQLTMHTVGGVVPAAQPLMQIVPQDGPVEIEAFIENKDKGFVHPGQSAAVKIDTYDYTKYGTLPAQVTHISQDAIEDERLGLIYSVKVLLDRMTLDVDGRTVRVTPGMATNVEIKTGDRRIIEYVLGPLVRHTHEAMNER